MPVLPLCMHITAVYLASLCEDHEEEDADDKPNDDLNKDTVTNLPLPPKPKPKKKPRMKRKKFLLVFLIVTNLPIAVYTCLIHQRGTVDVMKFLYDQAQRPKVAAGDRGGGGGGMMDVMFLMPCHSTPFHR